MKNFEFSKLKPKVQEFLDKEIPLYINGQYQTASSNTSFDVLDPSTGTVYFTKESFNRLAFFLTNVYSI